MSNYVRKIDFSDIIASPAQQEFLLAEYRKDKNTVFNGKRAPYPDGRFWVWCNKKLEDAKMGHIEPVESSAKTKPKAVSGVKRKAAEPAPKPAAPSMLITGDFQIAEQPAHDGDQHDQHEMVAINTRCITDEQLQLQRQEALLNQPDTPAGLFMGAVLAVQLGLCKTPGQYMVRCLNLYTDKCTRAHALNPLSACRCSTRSTKLSSHP
jgi:hypothetical protein